MRERLSLGRRGGVSIYRALSSLAGGCADDLLDVVVPLGDEPREDRLKRHKDFKEEIDERKDEVRACPVHSSRDDARGR